MQGEPGRRVAFNLLFIDGKPLSGPGWYARQVLAETALLNADAPRPMRLVAYLDAAAQGHFADLDLPGVDRVAMGPFANRAHRVATEQLLLPLRMRRDRIDLCFSPGFVSPLWGARHLVACIHDLYYKMIPEMLEPRQRRYWAAMIPATARAASRLIAVSRHTAADLEREVPAALGKVDVVPLASRLTPGAATRTSADVDGPFVLMVANLTPNKRIDTLARAVARARDAGLTLRLVQVGKDHDGRARAAASEAGIAELLIQPGHVDDARLGGLYAESFATVVASSYEGFGMPVLEAQAMGAALIASDAAAVPEAAGDGALFFAPDDDGQLARHLLALRDPALRHSLRERGRANVGARSWRDVARETCAVFDGLLAR